MSCARTWTRQTRTAATSVASKRACTPACRSGSFAPPRPLPAVPCQTSSLPASGGGEADVVSVGTLHCVTPQDVHWGAGEVPWTSAARWPSRGASEALRRHRRSRCCPQHPLPPPPRRIAFTTTDLGGARELALARIDYSCFTQNRLDAVMRRLGRLYARMRGCASTCLPAHVGMGTGLVSARAIARPPAVRCSR